MALTAKNTEGNVVSQGEFHALLNKRIRKGVRQTIETIFLETKRPYHKMGVA